MPMDLKDVTKAVPGVGHKLRWRRKIRGLSLQKVAERSGISIGLLSEVERGISTPSLQTLKAVCRALEMPMGWLFDAEPGGEAAEDEAGAVVRKGARRHLDLGASGMAKELMTPDSVPRIQMMRIIIRPGGSSGEMNSTIREGAKCGTVVSGRLGLMIGQREYDLGPGDSFAFEACVAHRFWCAGAEPAEIIWVVTPAVY
jgi:transcriptional regulator with XRE-family HTH domain